MLSSANTRNKELLQCLKITILTIVILIPSTLEAKAEPPLSANDIRAEIIGNSFRGEKGIMSVSLNYATDGTMTMQSLIGSGKGNWDILGNQLCITMHSGLRKGRECLTFIRQSDGSFRGSNGVQLTLME